MKILEKVHIYFSFVTKLMKKSPRQKLEKTFLKNWKKNFVQEKEPIAEAMKNNQDPSSSKTNH